MATKNPFELPTITIPSPEDMNVEIEEVVNTGIKSIIDPIWNKMMKELDTKKNRRRQF